LISAEATCFQKSMKMAFENTDLSEVCCCMSPGTIKGDITEYKAIENFLQACLY
jgi:hypothetical protein